MKRSWALGIVVLVAGCGPHYTIPNLRINEIEKVISSGRSPEGCIENLKEDAQKLNVKVRLTDVQNQASPPDRFPGSIQTITYARAKW